MRKGIASIDAFLALIVMFFVVFWMQNFFQMSFESSHELGAQMGVKAEAIRIGSIMNNFFAINPSQNDVLRLNGTVELFGEDVAVGVSKGGDALVTASVLYGTDTYSSSYPVAASIRYDSVSQKVMA